MTITTKPVWIVPGEEDPVEEVSVTTLLRYLAPDDEVWEEWSHFMHVVPVGHNWHERVTWRAHGVWSIELLDEHDTKYAQWNYAVPESVLWPLKKRRKGTGQ